MNNGFLTDGPGNNPGFRAGPAVAPASPSIGKPIYLIEAPATSVIGPPTAWGNAGTAGVAPVLGINCHSHPAVGRAIDIWYLSNTTWVNSFTLAVNGGVGCNTVTSTGNVIAGTAGTIGISGRGRIASGADGLLTFQNNALTDFTRTNFGGTTSSFPAIARSGTSLVQQLADGTAGGGLTVSLPLAKVGGCLEEFFTDANTPASTTETDLYSFTTIANTFASNGDKIIARFGGTYSSNATSVEIKVYFGGSQIFTTGLHGMAATEHWDIDVLLIRVSSGTVRCITKWIWSASSVSECTYSEVTGLTLSSTNILKITGRSNTGPASGDITAKLGYINWYPVG